MGHHLSVAWFVHWFVYNRSLDLGWCKKCCSAQVLYSTGRELLVVEQQDMDQGGRSRRLRVSDLTNNRAARVDIITETGSSK